MMSEETMDWLFNRQLDYEEYRLSDLWPADPLIFDWLAISTYLFRRQRVLESGKRRVIIHFREG